MTLLVRRSLPILAAGLALTLAGAGCAPNSAERAPTAPQATGGVEEGRLSAMAVAPPLGNAASYAVVASSTVTNTGPTVLNGDLGVSPGNAVVGFPPGIVNGTINAGNAASLAAQNSVTTAYNALAGQACDVSLTGQDLGGLTLTPGVYCFSSSAQLTGTLTLNGLGNPGAVWVFQIGSTLTTASGSRVQFINGGQACGVFWQVGSSATFGTTTTFAGNVLALASITANTGTTNAGGLFARTGAVTLDSNVVNVVGSCGSGPLPPPVPTLPEMAMLGLAVLVLAGGAFVLGRR